MHQPRKRLRFVSSKSPGTWTSKNTNSASQFDVQKCWKISFTIRPKSFQITWMHCETKLSLWILMDLVALGAGDFFDKTLEQLWENCCELSCSVVCNKL